MSIKVSLFHQTCYSYDRLVYLSPHLFRLKPAAHSRIPITDYSFSISPPNHIQHIQQDPFGNFITRIDFNGPIRAMTVEVNLVADITPINPFDFYLDTYAQFFPFAYEAQLRKDLSPYLEVSNPGPKMQQLLNQIDQSSRGIVDFLIMLNQLVYQNIAYTERMQPGVQTSEESLMQSLGSCRDSAWLLVQLLRHLGLAARFVSGYLVQLAPTAPVPGQTSGSDKDILALHAWAEVYIPGAGWVGLDATSGLLAGEGHIPLAGTPYPESAAPVTGTTDVCETTFSYSSKITRLP